MNIKSLINFDNYVYKFNMEDKQIRFKYEHSLRVMKIAHKISIKSKFDKMIVTYVKLQDYYMTMVDLANGKNIKHIVT